MSYEHRTALKIGWISFQSFNGWDYSITVTVDGDGLPLIMIDEEDDDVFIENADKTVRDSLHSIIFRWVGGLTIYESLMIATFSMIRVVNFDCISCCV